MAQFPVADIAGAINRGLQFRQQQELRPLEIATAQQQLDAGAQRQQFDQTQQRALEQQIDQRTDEQKNQSLFNTALMVDSASDAEIIPILESQIARVQQLGGDPKESVAALQLASAGDFNKVRQGAKNLIDIGIRQGDLKPQGGAQSAGQVEFESLTKGLSDAQKNEAVLIKLGISPRAVSSADITIAQSKELTQQIAQSKSIIGQRKKFGELTGASRAKKIDDGFERITKIDAGIGNIDRAIKALRSGAGVGAIERFLPSFKAASVELDNIQKSMALDVIGAVTFGALSQGELNLAKEVALPTGLDTPELIQHLQDRKLAQEKLRRYFSDQIQFLDSGGTVAGFLRNKERETNHTEVDQQQEGALTAAEQAELEQLRAELGGQ